MTKGVKIAITFAISLKISGPKVFPNQTRKDATKKPPTIKPIVFAIAHRRVDEFFNFNSFSNFN